MTQVQAAGTMDIVEAVRVRRSIRGYKPDPVPRDLIVRVLSESLNYQTPLNCRPITIIVVVGECLEALKRANDARIDAVLESEAAKGEKHDEAMERERNQAFFYGPLHGIARQRQIEIAKRLYGSQGIAREDRAGRAWWLKKGCRWFDAPVGLILTADQAEVNDQTMLYSAGTLSQTISLVALRYGLGTCCLNQVLIFTDTVREITGIPASRTLIVGMSLGYPDWDFPANNIDVPKTALDEILSWSE